MRTDGKVITRVTLLKKRGFWQRLDVQPFLVAYVTLGVLFAVKQWSAFSTLLCLGAAVILQILCWLARFWSAHFDRRIGYFVTSDLVQSTHLLVEPRVHRGRPEIVALRKEHDKFFFEFQCRRYYFDDGEHRFCKLRYPDEFPLSFYLHEGVKGLSTAEVSTKLEQYGQNRLQIPMPSFWELYKEQLTAPLFAFQVFCVILWCLDEMWKYSLMTLGMMLSFEATVVRSRQRSLRELRDMRIQPYPLLAYRDAKWKRVLSDKLVPLDLVALGTSPQGLAVPCDILLLAGKVVVNESLLTGESVPLMKEALRIEESEAARSAGSNGSELQPRTKDKMHVLFGGTMLLQTETPGNDWGSIPPPPGNYCVGCVLRTGFGSAQGKLLRTIMYSSQTASANNRESFLCILFLLVFAVVASAYVLHHGLRDPSRSRYELLLHCVLIITSVIPPELPMQLSLAVQGSLADLAKMGIFCTEPFRIPYAGMLDVCLFDKTGTLTVDRLDFAGLLCTGQDSLTPAENMPKHAILVLAACNSLVSLSGEVSGDPIESAAFRAIGWTLGANNTVYAREGSCRGTRIQILQRHGFDATIQRMSVAVSVSDGESTRTPYLLSLVKGSPESVRGCLREVPPDYDAQYRQLAMDGMRVIALATKELSAEMTHAEIRRLSRGAIECELQFAGFAAFRCPARPDSRGAIKALRKSNHLVAMITGDSLMTALYVALETGICSRRKKNLILCTRPGEAATSDFVWVKPSRAIHGKIENSRKFEAAELPKLGSEYNLTMTGDVLNEYRMRGASLKELLQYVQVFARMTPSQKELVITSLKDAGMYCLMCGDGTNDVGALKQAHVGVALLQSVAKQDTLGSPSAQSRPSLDPQLGSTAANASLRAHASTSTRSHNGDHRRSESSHGPRSGSLLELDNEMPIVRLGDASIASPFTSKRASIASCVDIIRQGRCTLVTTLQMYQILALNCLISAYSLSVLYLEGVKFGDRQMTVTGILIAIAFYFVSRGKPLARLAPQRPPRSMFTPSLFISLVGQFAIHLFALACCTTLSQAYLPPDFEVDLKGEFAPNILNTIVFLLSTMQQVSVFLVNYKGEPFMQSITKNKALLYSLLACAFLMLAACLEVSPELNQYMELAALPSWQARWLVFALLSGDFIAAWIWNVLVHYLATLSSQRIR